MSQFKKYIKLIICLASFQRIENTLSIFITNLLSKSACILLYVCLSVRQISTPSRSAEVEEAQEGRSNVGKFHSPLRLYSTSLLRGLKISGVRGCKQTWLLQCGVARCGCLGEWQLPQETDAWGRVALRFLH